MIDSAEIGNELEILNLMIRAAVPAAVIYLMTSVRRAAFLLAIPLAVLGDVLIFREYAAVRPALFAPQVGWLAGCLVAWTGPFLLALIMGFRAHALRGRVHERNGHHVTRKPDHRPRVVRFLTSGWNVLLVLSLLTVGAGFIPDTGRNPASESISLAVFASVLVLLAGGAVSGLAYGFAPRVDEQCCKACGYDLTGNTSGVCPECGERT